MYIVQYKINPLILSYLINTYLLLSCINVFSIRFTRDFLLQNNGPLFTCTCMSFSQNMPSRGLKYAEIGYKYLHIFTISRYKVFIDIYESINVVSQSGQCKKKLCLMFILFSFQCHILR